MYIVVVYKYVYWIRVYIYVYACVWRGSCAVVWQLPVMR